GQLTEARGPEFPVIVSPVVDIGASAQPRLVTVTSTTSDRLAQSAGGSQVIAPEESPRPIRVSVKSQGTGTTDATNTVSRGLVRRLPRTVCRQSASATNQLCG